MQTPNAPTIAQEAHRHFLCPSCGADRLYEPLDGFLSCSHCGHKEEIPGSAAEVQERSFEQYLKIRPEQLTYLAADALEVRCQSCGAMITFTSPQVAGKCDFCGVQIVAEPKAADPILTPGGVLPFHITQQQAQTGLRSWLAERWFAPNALKQLAQPDAIDGVYLPFWTYDANALTYYSADRGEYHDVTESYLATDVDGDQVSKSREMRYTRWVPASGSVSRWFDDVLLAATVSVPHDHLEALKPWDLENLKPYNPGFLSGFKAHRYQVDVTQGFERVRELAAKVIVNDVRTKIGGEVQMIHQLATHYSGITFKYLLLPVYVGAYRFNGKVYQILVNGRTGEIQGVRPYSLWKIALLLLTIPLFILILFAIFGRWEL